MRSIRCVRGCPVWTVLACTFAVFFAGGRTPAYAQAIDPDFKPELVAAEFSSREVRPGDRLAVTLKFRNKGTKAARSDYMVFLHFESPEKGCPHIVMQRDHEPSLSTSQWQPGKVVVDGPQLLVVPADRPDQTCHVHVGLFSTGGRGERLLDTYVAGVIRVSGSAPPSGRLGPEPLAREEVEKRRRDLAARIPDIDRASLDTSAWRFAVGRGSAVWTLLDKASGVMWNSDPVQPRFGQLVLRNGERTVVWPIERFDEIREDSGKLSLITRPQADGKPTGVSVTFTLTPLSEPAGLRLAYDSTQTADWRVARVRLLDSSLTVTEEDGGLAYVPHRLGIERTADSCFPGRESWTTYDDLSMAMCGLVKQGSALLLNWEDVEARLSIDSSWPDMPLVPGRRACAVSLELGSPKGMCSLHPLGRGGYVEIARAYRPLAKAKGWLRTWAEKRKEYPTVDRMFGAADFKPFVFSRVVPGSRFSKDGKEHAHLSFTFEEAAQCAEHWRNDLGIDRAMVVLAGWINGGYDVRHPDVLPAAPECGGDKSLADAAARIKACGYLFGLHDNYQDMYENAPSFGHSWLNKDAQGKSRMGGNWNGGQAWQVCAIKQVELAERSETNLPRVSQLFDPAVYFIDTVFAWPLVTCEDPSHPMTRGDDLRWKTRLCLLAKKHFGLFGSEEGREWAVPCSDYLEGLFTQQTDAAPGQVIPLFPLVYSDCAQIMTHQSYRIGPGADKMIVDHVLFAEMALPSFGNHLYWKTNNGQPEAARGLWDRGDGGWTEKLTAADRVIKNSWEVLSPLNVITAEMPLASHEFVTADRMVQRTRFGDVTVTVAYQRPAEIEGNALPANGFIIESPQFVAFCATRFGGIEYGTPALFTARSLDGKPIAESSRVRIYHGFGDLRIKLSGKQFEVAREEIVSVK